MLCLLRLIVDLISEKERKDFWKRAKMKIKRKGEQTAREDADLRADHVFMQHVSGIVISL